MKKAFSILFLFAIVVTAAAFYVQSQEKKVVEKVHYHAGFQVYIDNQLQDYSDFKYMNMTPCSTEEVKLTPEEEQLQKAHLHDQTGDVVHVHRAGATWGDLFTNIGVELPTDNIQAYDQQATISNILDTEIQPYQSIIIVAGDQSKVDTYRQTMVTREAIEEAEKVSELCAG